MFTAGDIVLSILSFVAGGGLTILFQRITGSVKDIKALFDLLEELTEFAEQAIYVRARRLPDQSNFIAMEIRRSSLHRSAKTSLARSSHYPQLVIALDLLTASLRQCDPEFGPLNQSADVATSEIRHRAAAVRNSANRAADHKWQWRAAKLLTGETNR